MDYLELRSRSHYGGPLRVYVQEVCLVVSWSLLQEFVRGLLERVSGLSRVVTRIFQGDAFCVCSIKAVAQVRVNAWGLRQAPHWRSHDSMSCLSFTPGQ